MKNIELFIVLDLFLTIILLVADVMIVNAKWFWVFFCYFELKSIDFQNKFADLMLYLKFLQKKGIIKEDEQMLLNYIGLDELNIIVIGQSTCSYCVQAKIVLNELVERKGVEINYLNISYLNSDETNSLDYFKDGFGTPVMLITKNGNLIDTYEGYVPLESYIDFLEENEVL